ncbi:MAG TPA: hypothetical protein VG165_05910 [Solirubrobacteraceae bacterium]|jgi:hypothetical protein|nr:hypothetical protein [Solirubrobacteraceae bacterium]
MPDLDDQPADETSVLASLTGTRPQRRSSKRPATKPARRSVPPAADSPGLDPPKPGSPKPGPSKPGSSKPGKPAPSAPRARRAAQPPPATPPPAQGFEPNPIAGRVDPPTGTELLASVAQGATELAELGVAVGRRLARSLIDRLPRI